MKLFKILFLALSLFLVITCDKNPSGYHYDEGFLPDTPVNLTAYNTVYDDYNSTSPSLGVLNPFCFSTNRNSGGGQFDVIYEPMAINFNRTTGNLTVDQGYTIYAESMSKYFILKNEIHNINTSGNEFGPYLLADHTWKFTLLYASDVSGNFQINYAKSESNFSEIEEVAFLNSDFDDLYPCFNEDRSKLFFCSNREENNFDIYYSTITNSQSTLDSILSDNSEHIINKEVILSSSSNDKCPFLYKNMLIFTSDRPGGYGGYDLYYSLLVDDTWSAPINFGPEINSEFDEYRPILIDEEVSYSQSMMIFSSNREGGKGGFDLYYVGVSDH